MTITWNTANKNRFLRQYKAMFILIRTVAFPKVMINHFQNLYRLNYKHSYTICTPETVNLKSNTNSNIGNEMNAYPK